MKRKHLALILAMLAVLTVALLFARWRGYQSALYQGRHVRDWAMDFSNSINPTNREAAAAALSAMGTNAVPALVAMLHERDGFYEKPLMKNARQIPYGLRTNLFTHFPPGAAETKRFAGVYALQFLGDNAAAAIPELVESANDSSERVAWVAIQALGRIGGDAVPHLFRIANDPVSNHRFSAIYALGYVPEKSPATINLLMTALSDTNRNVRDAAQYSLRAAGTSALSAICARLRDHDPLVHSQLVSVVTAIGMPHQMLLFELIRQTRNTSSVVRLQGAESLSNLELSNLNTVTALTRILNDPDESVRRAATNGLKKINVLPTTAE